MQFLLCRPTFHYPMRHLPVNYQYSIGKNHQDTLLLLWRHRTVSRVLLSSSLSPTAPTVVLLVKHKLASVQPLDRLDLRLGIGYSLGETCLGLVRRPTTSAMTQVTLSSPVRKRLHFKSRFKMWMLAKMKLLIYNQEEVALTVDTVTTGATSRIKGAMTQAKEAAIHTTWHRISAGEFCKQSVMFNSTFCIHKPQRY